MKESKQVQDLRVERDALRARVEELESQAAVLREAVAASDNFESLIRAVEHALANRENEMAAAYRAEAERARQEARRARALALGVNAGRKMFERVLRLEQECREWRSLLAAIAKQHGGEVRISLQTISSLPPDAAVEVSSSDPLHSETIVSLAAPKPQA